MSKPDLKQADKDQNPSPSSHHAAEEAAFSYDFAHSLPMALLRAREMAMNHFRPVLSEFGLTEQQWRVIRALYDTDAIEISELARCCCILAPSMTGILKRLEARGLIVRKANAHDQRSSLISLTDEARAMTQTIAPKVQVCYAEIETKLSPEKLKLLYQLLFELESALS